MNSCNFVGQLVEMPSLQKNGNVKVAYFQLSVEDYRKDKDGHKKSRVDILDFEIWDSGAEALCSTAKVGSTVIIESVARNDYDEENESDVTYFRVKSFKVV